MTQLLFFSAMLFAQNQMEIRPKYMPMGGKHRNIIDESGRKQGLWKYYSADGILIAEVNYQNGIKHGTSIKYHPLLGVPIEESTYFNGLLDGDYKKYYGTGELKTDGYYKDGKKTGKWNTYYKVNGEKRSEGEYVNDKKEGLWRLYSSKGKLTCEGPYLHNLKEGEWKYYDQDGKVIATLSFVKDVEQTAAVKNNTKANSKKNK